MANATQPVGCQNSVRLPIKPICRQWAIPLTHPDEFVFGFDRSSRSIGLRFYRLLTSTPQTAPRPY
jgi:hypothetical protein